MSNSLVYTSDELEEVYEGLTARAVVELTFTSELVGGQPAAEEGVRAFCQHQLKLAGDDLEAAVRRILKQEVGERELKVPEGGEIKETESYAVNCLRRTTKGLAWVGDWQVKAMLKQAASRLGYFVAHKGTKGDLAEMARVAAAGASACGDSPFQLVLTNPDGTPYKTTVFTRFRGHVSSASGSHSIMQDCEVAPIGTRLAFEWRFPPKRFTEVMMTSIIASCQNIGLGSAKSFERGKFVVDRMEVWGLDKADKGK
jgi:hypothetical protein